MCLFIFNCYNLFNNFLQYAGWLQYVWPVCLPHSPSGRCGTFRVKYHIGRMCEELLPSSALSGLLQREGSLIYACAKLVFASVEKVLMETGGGFGT